MARLSSIEDFKALERMLFGDDDKDKPRIVICAGTACQASGASNIVRVAKKHIIAENLLGKVTLRITGCHGFCEMGPFILTEPQQAFYTQIGLQDVPQIIDALLREEYVEDLLYKDPVTGEKYYHIEDIPFFKNQTRVILDANTKIDPIRIFDYIKQGGYSALAQVLSSQDPEWIIKEVTRSGLRGRGGAGFPTGTKWSLLAKEPSDRGKYLVCNADEGDPGAYMDRSVLEGNPHSIIEGMLIGAYATGATEGVIYVRTEYPLAIKHLTIALRQARDLGVLGENILGSGFSFDINIVRGAGAFVCGEETALIKSIEGHMGEPRQRPPFPIQKGIHNKPTAINNVETWANVPIIFNIGAKAFAETGTMGSSGTKIFSLVGKIKNTGLVEVPMGITVGEIVFGIGGGPAAEAKIKAVQTGGPSGGCIPVEKFDQTIDYHSLAKTGAIMGSGGMIVMDENTCMIDVAKYYMGFLKDESCGKCFPCRKGTQRMYEILDDISNGKATLADIDLIEALALAVRDSTMCGLGRSAANPVLSTLMYFREEYERHVVDKRCDAAVCKALTGAPCQATCPLGTEVWRYVAHIARGELDSAYQAIRVSNPFPSVCARVCNHPCESKCRAGSHGGNPVAIRALKRFVTDNVDPSVYKPAGHKKSDAGLSKVAIVGAGPSGLTAAHYLSIEGYKVTVFESEAQPGGMLTAAIPSYRLPREAVQKEIAALIDDNVTLKCNMSLGKDLTVDGLFEQGFAAIYLAFGAHKSRALKIENENAEGIYSSMAFLKAFNLRGEALATGRVGVIGGGNSAIDAARVALRQPDVKSVSILYRRDRNEMPAFAEEIEAALEEGIVLETLVTPVCILTNKGSLKGVEFVRNTLGDRDSSGRRSPVPVNGSEFTIGLDTLIVAISESPDLDCLAPSNGNGIDTIHDNRVANDDKSLCTNRPGVFAGGDVATGPSTVVDAIAAGKRAAVMMHRYLMGKELKQSIKPQLPDVHIEPAEISDEDRNTNGTRAEPPTVTPLLRIQSFDEVEQAFGQDAAVSEALRCLRCDLEFTEQNRADHGASKAKEKQA
ncbi:MAG: NADH-ubiquinone oxidoreductase-F iron-sulfur binding region domain-containing protein [Myxococcota bacterium]|nr:NADH-ubiquinone oxidoreductase-F iron-sulfur binding region domain-containing protein [Myxococcota bacterium]